MAGMELSVFVCMLMSMSVAAVHLYDKSRIGNNHENSWMEYKRVHGKQYANEEEEAFRRSVWLDRVTYVQKHNSEARLGQHSFTMAINKYSDLTREEYRKYLLGYSPSHTRKHRRLTATAAAAAATERSKILQLLSPSGNISTLRIPKTVDWRLEGYVTHVKDQGEECGGCWAFAATGALEGQHFKKTGKLVSLSEQNLIDCVKEHPDGQPAVYEEFGCKGAEPNDAFYYVSKNGGIDTEQAYPYQGKDGSCHYKSKTNGANCTGFLQLVTGDEDNVKLAVALKGPIAAGMDADNDEFKEYQSGILESTFCSSVELNHAVLIVGYGTTADDDDYWLIKNSWGTTWGMNGYAMLPRNRGNRCGIASDCSFPTVD